MNSKQADWTPDKVLETVQGYVDAGTLTETAALRLLERLPFRALSGTLEELAARDSLESSVDEVLGSGRASDSTQMLTKLIEKLVKLSANSAGVRRYVPLEQLLDLIRLGLCSQYVLVRAVTLRLLCVILDRKEMPEEFCQLAADTILERFGPVQENGDRPIQVAGGEGSAGLRSPSSADFDLLLRLLEVFRDDPSTETAALCEKVLKHLVELRPLRGAVALLHDGRGAHILVAEMLAGEAGSVALIRALNLLLELCDRSSVVENAARRLLPSTLVSRVAERIRVDEDMLLRLNLLDILGGFMKRSAVAAELLDQVAVFDVLLRQHLLFLLAPTETPSVELIQRWFLWLCTILRFMRTSAGANRCAFYGWIDASLVELLGRFLLRYTTDEESIEPHWILSLDTVRRMTLLGHLIAAVGSLGLCERGMDVLLADVDTLKLALRFVRHTSVSEVRAASLQALCVFLCGSEAPLWHQGSLAHCMASADLEVRQHRIWHLFADALREVDPSGAPVDALSVVLECCRRPSEEERLAALHVLSALTLSRFGFETLSSPTGFVEMLMDTSDSSLTVLEGKANIARCLVEQHSEDGELVFGSVRWRQVVGVASSMIRETVSRQQTTPSVNIATLNQ